MRRGLALVAVLLGALPASAQSSPQFVCSARAEGTRGEGVSVLIHIEPDGSRAASYATWDPPVASTALKGGFEQPELSLYVPYDAAAKGSLGAPGAIAVNLLVLSDFRKPAGAAKLKARLDQLTVAASLDGAAAQGVALAPPPLIPDMPGTAARTGTIRVADRIPARIDLALRDRKGRSAGTVQYDLSGTASRDALFARAWSQAEAAGADFTKCEQTAAAE
ncbi:MAG: hypothetical protein ACKOPE_11070 [Novosphingobium sp.]